MKNKLTAEQARELFMAKPYPLEQILCHIRSVAVNSHCVQGYHNGRFSDDVKEELSLLGYKLTYHDSDVIISWK